MNSNILEGKWREIKGEVQKRWASLTNDELDRVKGNFNSLAGLIQKKFGYAQEEARQRLNDVLAKFDTGTDFTRDDSYSTRQTNKSKDAEMDADPKRGGNV